MKRFFKLQIAAWLGVLMCTAVTAAPLRVAGRVTNGTRNDAPVVNAPVRLLRIDPATGQSRLLKTAKSGPTGRFDLGRFDVNTQDLLFTRVEWQNYPYVAPAYVGASHTHDAGIKPDQLNLHVFDTTKDSPRLVFTVHHVAIESEGSTLKCVERIVVENPSRRTFIGSGEDGVTIGLALPAGARDVAIDPSIPDARLVKIGKVYGVAKPITPLALKERNAIIVNYTMPWTRGGVDLSRRLLYPTKFFFVARIEADRKLKIAAARLGTDQETSLPLDGSMQTRIVNSIGPSKDNTPVLEAGTLVAINVTRPINPLVWAFVAFVGALCAVVPLTLLRGRGGRHGEPIEAALDGSVKTAEPALDASVKQRNPLVATAPSTPGSGAAGPAQLQDLIEKIAHLDDEWEAGAIERDEYQNRRAAWKRTVVELMCADGDKALRD
jgi:hypothetical protein